MNLQDIQKDYSERNAELQKVEDRIEMRERQIERLKRKEQRARDKAHWTRQVDDIMNIVAEKTPHIKWEDSDRFTTGLRSQYWRFGKTKADDITVGICFTPDEDSHVQFDTGETKPGYHPRSIGAMNGFNKVSKRLEDIQELIDLVATKEQQEKQRRAEEV